MWTVTYVNHEQILFTVWDDQRAAMRDVCAQIINDMNDSFFDLNDSESRIAVEAIEKLIASGSYDDAIEAWNKESGDRDFNIYWSVDQVQIFNINDAATPGGIVYPDKDEEEEAKEQTVVPIVSADYLATEPGATCRGPCGSYNEYAYADKSDGTHMCRQCSTFQHIFGTKQ
jgi:hypothetical protein